MIRRCRAVTLWGTHTTLEVWQEQGHVLPPCDWIVAERGLALDPGFPLPDQWNYINRRYQMQLRPPGWSIDHILPRDYIADTFEGKRLPGPLEIVYVERA